MQIDRIKKARIRRKLRVHKKVLGTQDRPRLSIFRSNRHIYAQIIDDVAAVTLASAGTRSGAVQDSLKKTGNIEAAKVVGAEIAKQAMQVGIKCVKFDRNRYRYHGRVKALAEAAREAGLVF
ncbi:MAG: 50S ribosomal protein L18 [Planctomycetes bacterium]|nr:50S ribosomal protein L18 [Planctomycetota bacterium]MBU1517322.1 50S ribosomal protein L18 [Planctomycetota bacterium]MBU2458426.1 50S ribosomal protein L18 [Planctomycetota bacterium]MBU2596438.1 50S ribosomal protein L18 [Planctomycetota bacterium]